MLLKILWTLEIGKKRARKRLLGLHKLKKDCRLDQHDFGAPQGLLTQWSFGFSDSLQSTRHVEGVVGTTELSGLKVHFSVMNTLTQQTNVRILAVKDTEAHMVFIIVIVKGWNYFLPEACLKQGWVLIVLLMKPSKSMPILEWCGSGVSYKNKGRTHINT